MTGLGLTVGLVIATWLVNLPYSFASPTSISGDALLKRQSKLSWGMCPGDVNNENQFFTFSCANFTVPLDWTNEQDTRKAILNVVKLSPMGGSTAGTIFTSAGDAQSLLMSLVGRRMYETTRGRFDIVSWDPRGVGESQPRITCVPGMESLDAADHFRSNLTFYNRLECDSSGPTQSDIDSFLGRAPQVDAYFKTMVDSCQQKHGDDLKYVGAMATVRDLVAIANVVVGADQPIHYWGFNFGTLIGQYLMALYPQRIGRVVLDGIINVEDKQRVPHKYFSSDIQDAELALSKFYQACADAGPQNCKLAPSGSSGDSIKQSMNRLIDLAYRAGAQPELFDSSSTSLRGRLRQAASGPSQYSAVEKIVDIRGHYNFTSRRRSTLDKRIARPRSDYLENDYSSRFATFCGDVVSDIGSTTTQEVMSEIVRITKEQSNVFGPSLNAYFETYCHLWPVRSVERFQGSFNPQFVNPIIIIGVSASVTSPYSNAVALHSKLNSGVQRRAALIRHDGVGTNSFAMPSACTKQIIGGYFIDGNVPEDTICGTNLIPFSKDDVPNPSSIISAPLQSSTQRGSNSAKRVDYGHFVGSLATIVVAASLMF